jgi:PAS domain S-box-containing protein
MDLGRHQHFLPHGTCYSWNPDLLRLQAASDVGIALAYFSIPVALLYVIWKRRDTRFAGFLAPFALFAIACGLTHVMELWTIWRPAFWAGGKLEAVTAVLSLAAAAVLVPSLPKLLSLRTPSELHLLNATLARENAAGLEALAAVERQYQNLAAAMPLIVWTADAAGSIDFYNRCWFAYTGLTPAQNGGSSWRSIVHRDDSREFVEAWKRSVRDGTPFEVEARLKRAVDGAYRWHLCRAQPTRDAEGAIDKWFGSCIDIDERKTALDAVAGYADTIHEKERLERDMHARKHAEAALRASEELFRKVEEFAPIGLALVSLDGFFLRVNPALCALTGYSSAELRSRTVHEITHPDDRAADRALLERALEGLITHYELQKRYILKDGNIVWVHVHCSLVRDDAGERPSYFIRQTQDITEWKNAEVAIKAAQRDALAAASAKSRFLATMSHEIRTPMNGIIGVTELLSLSKLSAEQNEYVRIVHDSGRSLLRVLNDILDYSKIEAGKLELEYFDFEVRAQLTSIVSLLGPQFATKRVMLASEVEPDVPLALRGDPGRIRQVLMNLMGNALKFTPPGGAVRVIIAREAQAGDVVPIRFTIVDTGPGITQEGRARLFQPFSQVDESTTRKYGGTGLGLSICKQLVDIMGGTIGVESAGTSGSSFWFSIPFQCAEAVAPSPETQAAASSATVTAHVPRTERILLAEDNEVNALLAMRQFKRLGFTISVVANGREALEAVAAERFDAVFMDCHMPEMDGLDATRRIRTLADAPRRCVPIIAMTADAQAEDKASCLAAGMDDYISKPASLADLQRAIERWIPVAAASGLDA